MTHRLSVGDLARRIRDLGVSPGDLVMVHASLRALGPVATGALGVVDALDAAVGPTGTWLMVYGDEDQWGWVNDRPEAERPALLADAPPFDPWRAPVLREVGTLAEVMRVVRGTVVSPHPEGRFGARGARAAELMARQPRNDYYGPGTVLDELVRSGGRVLRLGADRDTLTALHLAEYLADVPDKLRVRRHRTVVGADGPEVVVVECLDDEDGIVPAERQPEEDYFAVVLGEYLAAGRALAVGRVGGATAELLDSADLVRFGADWMTAHLR